ncbi:MAG TPA: response regulator [bacterium]|nr:response regulator [bacterium]
MQTDGWNSDHHRQAAPVLAEKNRVFTILVVEGSLSFEGFVGEFFKAGGHYILRAASREDALAQTREHKPDLILLDNEMKDALGLVLLPELLLEHASAAVVVMAGHPSVDEAVEAMKLGAVEYLERPLDPEKLRRAIETQKALFKRQP